MGVYLNPGNDKFYKAINSEIYVDKTELIQYTNRVFNTKTFRKVYDCKYAGCILQQRMSV